LFESFGELFYQDTYILFIVRHKTLFRL